MGLKGFTMNDTNDTISALRAEIEALRAENNLLRRVAEKNIYYADQHWSASYPGGKLLPEPSWMKGGDRALWRAVSNLEEEIEKSLKGE